MVREGRKSGEDAGLETFIETFRPMRPEEIVKAELVSRFMEAIIKGTYLYIMIEFKFWLDMIKKSRKVKTGVLKEYEDKAEKELKKLMRKAPPTDGTIYDRRENKAIRQFAEDSAQRLFKIVPPADFKKGIRPYLKHMYAESQEPNAHGDLPVNHLIGGISAKEHPMSEDEVGPDLASKSFFSFDINAAYKYEESVRRRFFKQALERVARYLVANPSFGGLYIDSWIVASNPRLVELFGFTVLYAHRINELGQRVVDRTVHAPRAYMTSAECRKRYLPKK
ncbi:MAG: hypothetical protein AAB573_02075 [Patescibacteria group bacterium]